jgi:hypothetical protein
VSGLTFAAWHAATRDIPGWARAEWFRFLSDEDQRACWGELAERMRLLDESERLYEGRLREEWPPKRHQPLTRSTAATPTKPGEVALSLGDDPLKAVPPSVYFEALAGIVVPPNGWVSCPMPDHEDRTPSCRVLSTYWRCFGCGRGGGIIDLAAGLYGSQPRGRGYWQLRDRILEALVWAPLRPEEAL